MAAGAGGTSAAQERDVAEIAGVADPLQQLVQATAQLDQLRQCQSEVLVLRDAAMAELHQRGHSYAEIAQVAGTTRGRVAQIIRAQRAR
jgi:DNA-directed RNA polymerase specialized sigma24 family protein